MELPDKLALLATLRWVPATSVIEPADDRLRLLAVFVPVCVWRYRRMS